MQKAMALSTHSRRIEDSMVRNVPWEELVVRVDIIEK